MKSRDLVDQTELALLLDIPVGNLRAYRADAGKYRVLDGLPAPLRHVNGGPVWARAEIDTWLTTREPS